MLVYLSIILLFIISGYVLNLIIELLNLKRLKTQLPEEFKNIYNQNEYEKSQKYTKEKTKFALFIATIEILILIPFIVFGGFNFLDKIIRQFKFNDIISGVLFSLLLIILIALFKLPFSAYSTFIIEEKYGFNRTSVKTFIIDIIKSFLLLLIIGIPVLALILWFFEFFGSLAWLYVWGFVSLFQIFMLFIAPVIIMPLFNKYTPLEDSDLKTEIEEYADNQNFKLKGIYKMDGSKRSSKSNAFFTGFGKFKRIVLFDTLIEKQSKDELLSILAHEMGHYKLKHIYKTILISFAETGLLLFILSIFLKNEYLFEAFRMEHISVYASLVFFGFLYAPVSEIVGILSNILSRKYEYQADNYAVRTIGKSNAFISALKKLSVDNLTNLTPHPLKVFIEYSHPPVLKRIKNIKNIKVE